MKLILKFKTNMTTWEFSIEENSSIVLGRKSDCKIPDSLVSGNHCKLTLTSKRLQITDMASKNGTFLNGARVEQSEVFIGDEIKIGETKVTILADKSDSSLVKALIFAGDPKDRVAQNLKLDYTSVGMPHVPSVKVSNTPDKMISPGMEREIKKPQYKVKLSKEEIKKNFKKKSSLSATLDIIFFIFIIAIPLLLTNGLYLINPENFQKFRLIMIPVLEFIFISTFYYFNYKKMKFTIGERLSGIQQIYEDQ